MPVKKVVTPKKSKYNGSTTDTAIEAAIRKAYGFGVVLHGRQIVDNVKTVIPVCPALDLVHSGGWQEGSFVTLSGPPRCGKTTTALHFAARCQRPEWGGRKVIFLEAEARLESRDLLGIPGLILDDPSKFIRIGPSQPVLQPDGTLLPGKILTAEEYLKIAEMYLQGGTRCIIILDSISILCEEAEWIGGLGKETRGGAQKLFAQFVRRMCQVIPTNRHIFIGIVHLMSNTSGYGASIVEKMSNAANYGLSTKLRASGFKYITEPKSGFPIAQQVFWRCDRSPLGAPGREVTSYLRYGHGIDEIMENIIFGLESHIIAENGTWYSLPFVKDNPKAQGKENLYSLLYDNPEWAAQLAKTVREGQGL